MRRSNFWTGLAGVIVGALLVSAVPVIAQDAEPQASPGDNFKLGQTNIVNANTSLRGNTASNLVVRNTGNGVPLNLINAGNGKPPMKVDSRRLVRNLNADQLDFRHANELIRAAYGSTDNASEFDPDAVTATITAPQPGYLIMGGSIDASGGTSDSYRCHLEVDGRIVNGTARFSRVHYAGDGHTRNESEDCSTDGGYAVGKGTHTVALHIVGRDTVGFNDASVWVIWVPFDGQGNIPNPADNPIPSTDPTPLDKHHDETG